MWKGISGRTGDWEGGRGGKGVESWVRGPGCDAMLGFYYVEVMCSRFSHAAEVFLHGEARSQLDLLAEPLLFTVVNHVMFGILLVAVVYILAHFLLTAVIVSRLFLVGCWVISSGGPWMSVPVEWLMILNKQCPRLAHAESEPPTQCSVCLEMISPGCVKRKLNCAHQFHAR